MISYASIILLGFFLGMRHSTDPDHVIAVATIVTRSRKLLDTAAIGIAWGVGHTLTVSVVGAGIILFNLVISPRVGLGMELAVGVMLVVLGLMNVGDLRRWLPAARAGDPSAFRLPLRAVSPPRADRTAKLSVALTPRQSSGSPGEVEGRESKGDHRHDWGEGTVHSHFHSHGDYVHCHPHEHNPDAHPHPADQTPLASLDRVFGRIGLYRHLRPFIVGIVHGLAGSAAVALLFLTTIRNPRWAVAYLVLFGAGTIAGMMLITITMASTFRIVGGGRQWFSGKLRLASGLVSLAFGLFLAYQICFVHGFLSSSPQWTPH